MTFTVPAIEDPAFASPPGYVVQSGGDDAPSFQNWWNYLWANGYRCAYLSGGYYNFYTQVIMAAPSGFPMELFGNASKIVNRALIGDMALVRGEVSVNRLRVISINGATGRHFYLDGLGGVVTKNNGFDKVFSSNSGGPGLEYAGAVGALSTVDGGDWSCANPANAAIRWGDDFTVNPGFSAERKVVNANAAGGLLLDVNNARDGRVAGCNSTGLLFGPNVMGIRISDNRLALSSTMQMQGKFHMLTNCTIPTLSGVPSVELLVGTEYCRVTGKNQYPILDSSGNLTNDILA